MAKRRVVWTKNSEVQLKAILIFFNKRNKSPEYSKKLYMQFKSKLKIVADKPELGIQTKIENIRGLIVGDYILFYEIQNDRILVLKVWDCRQNPDKLDIPK